MTIKFGWDWSVQSPVVVRGFAAVPACIIVEGFQPASEVGWFKARQVWSIPLAQVAGEL